MLNVFKITDLCMVTYSKSAKSAKRANLTKQKYMKNETAAQNIKKQLKTSTHNEKAEELKTKPTHGQFNQGTLKDHQ
jgi:hypothetical protein